MLLNIIQEHTCPFEYGKSDCCIFAADVLKEIHGHDPMEGYRGRYSCRRSAAALLREKRVRTLLGAFQRTFKKEIHPDDAVMGDVGLWDGRIICVRLDHHWIMKSSRGVKVHSDNIERAWTCHKLHS